MRELFPHALPMPHAETLSVRRGIGKQQIKRL